MSHISSRRKLVRAASLLSALPLAVVATGGLSLAAGTGDTSDAVGFGPNPTGKRTVQPLKNECTTGEPQDLCRNIGVTDGWYEGQTIKFLYTQNFFCDPTVSSGAPSKCEAGAKYNNVPPGTTSDKFTDPLFIPVPLFKPGPKKLQCPANVACVDHPTTIDLSRLASALKMPASALKNTELPGHDHIITDRNNNRPEWWPVYVVAVTDPGSFAKIQAGKSFDTIKKLAANPKSGVSQPIPTNTFLWFQTLPGTNNGASDAGDAPAGGIDAGEGGTQTARNAGLMGAGAALAVGSIGAFAYSRRKTAAGRV